MRARAAGPFLPQRLAVRAANVDAGQAAREEIEPRRQYENVELDFPVLHLGTCRRHPFDRGLEQVDNLDVGLIVRCSLHRRSDCPPRRSGPRAQKRRCRRAYCRDRSGRAPPPGRPNPTLGTDRRPNPGGVVVRRRTPSDRCPQSAVRTVFLAQNLACSRRSSAERRSMFPGGKRSSRTCGRHGSWC